MDEISEEYELNFSEWSLRGLLLQQEYYKTALNNHKKRKSIDTTNDIGVKNYIRSLLSVWNKNLTKVRIELKRRKGIY